MAEIKVWTGGGDAPTFKPLPPRTAGCEEVRKQPSLGEDDPGVWSHVLRRRPLSGRGRCVRGFCFSVFPCASPAGWAHPFSPGDGRNK